MTTPRPGTSLRRALPYGFLLPIAVLMALAPFSGRPHLLEKLRMLFAGTLVRPIDIFDLVLHGTPVLLLAVRAGADVRAWIRRKEKTPS